MIEKKKQTIFCYKEVVKKNVLERYTLHSSVSLLEYPCEMWDNCTSIKVECVDKMKINSVMLVFRLSLLKLDRCETLLEERKGASMRRKENNSQLEERRQLYIF